MTYLIDKLYENNIQLSLDGEDLQIGFDGDQVPADLLLEIKQNKAALIDYLSKYSRDQAGATSIKRSVEKESYRLSSAQLRMWALSQFEEELVAYNMPNSVVLNKSYDLQSFEKALYAAIDRHEILRTVFRENEAGEVRQWILSSETLGFQLQYKDFRTYENREAEIQSYIEEDAALPFDLKNGPLLRACLLHETDERLVFYYNMHHIIGDGWSFNVLFRDVLAFYEAFATGREAELPQLDIQYKDFSEWENEQFELPFYQTAKAYWLEKLSGTLPLLDLPSEKSRPGIKTNRGHKLAYVLQPERVASLRAYTMKNGGSLFMGILAAMQTLFYRYSGQNDMILGSPIAGRDLPELKEQIGFYVNTLTLRNNLAADLSFDTIFAQAVEDTLSSYKYQQYPFDRLVEDLQVKRDIGRCAIFDVMVTLHNKSDHNREEDLQVGQIQDLGPHLSRFDLEIDFEEVNGHLLMSVLYNVDVYEHRLIHKLIQHYAVLLELLLETPEKPVGEIDYLSPQEKEVLLKQFNDTIVDFPHEKTFVHLFAEQAARTPEAVALKYNDTQWTYKTLDEHTDRLANYLVEVLELPKQSFVGILTERSHHTLAAILATLKAGCVYIPIDPAYPEKRIKEIIDDAAVPFLFITKDHVGLSMKLQWECDSFEAFLCLDSEQVYDEFVNKDREYGELWNYVGESATNAIEGGGWISSFTGEPFSEKEMDEYAASFLNSISGVIDNNSRVLEVGCASGITLRKVLPHVKEYVAVDLSQATIRKLGEALKEEKNVSLHCLSAMDIDRLEGQKFDAILINSVIQDFESHNYLLKVIQKAFGMLSENGHLCIGDVMDLGKKDQLIGDLIAFENDHKGKGYTTKTDFSAELFLHRDYFDDLASTIEGVTKVSFKEKTYTIANELTDYRYDVILSKGTEKDRTKRRKRQHDLRVLQREMVKTAPRNLAENTALAYVIYTSGSTGKPKGALIEHRGLVNHLYAMIDQMDIGEGSSIVQNAAVSFDISVWQFLTALMVGGKTVIYDRPTVLAPQRFLTKLKQDGIDILQVVPSYLTVLLDFDKERYFEGLTYLLVTGEAVKQPLLARFFEQYQHIKVVNAYGPAEASDDVTLHIMDKAPIHTNVSIGRPIQNLQVHILDETGKLCPIGVVGEICIAGIGVGRGYLNNEALTHAHFVPSPYAAGTRMYKSGDLGKWSEEGTLFFMGRKDEQVKVRGHRIELGEVEQQLLSLVDEAVVIVHEGELVAYHVDKRQRESQDLRLELGKLLPEYMLPSVFVALSALPLSKNGKIDKKALPDPNGLDLESTAYLAPRNDTEKSLVAIWEQTLGRQNIGVEDNFFELGGHSLKVIQLIFEIEQKFGVRPKIEQFFTAPTIAELAMEIESLHWIQTDEEAAGHDEQILII